MEDNPNYPSIHQTEHPKSFRDTFRDGSPDDVRDKMKDIVAKGVAAVAGALRGFTEESEREDVAGQSRSAIHAAGDTVGKTASTVTEEVKGLQQPLKDAGQKIRETVRDIGQTAKEEVSQTRASMRGGTSPSSETPSGYGSTSLTGGEMPELRSTPLSKSEPEEERE